jgi:serine/threonine protein kinase
MSGPCPTTGPWGEQYTVEGQIGEGAFGYVYRALRGPAKRVCAIKAFKENPKDPPVLPAPTAGPHRCYLPLHRMPLNKRTRVFRCVGRCGGEHLPGPRRGCGR